MSRDIGTSGWGVTGVDETEFLATAALLRIHEQSQDTTTQPCDARSHRFIDELDIDDASIICEELSSQESADDLISKALDRIAEVFARQKTNKDKKSRQQRRAEGQVSQDGDHVTASSFVKGNRGTQSCIILAKNGGFDEIDRKMARSLQTWLRALALTSKHPAIESDQFWMKLVDFYKSRLLYYIDEYSKLKEDTLDTYGDAIQPARELRSLCTSYLGQEPQNRTFDALHQILCLAYELRYADQPASLGGKSRRGRNLVAMLGRIRSSFENLKRLATDLPNICASIKVELLEVPIRKTHNTKDICRLIRDFSSQYNLPPPAQKRLDETLGKSKTSTESFYHAEMQILLHVESSVKPPFSIHSYIGCSKKACWLCSQVMMRYTSKHARDTGAGFYKNRGSHGGVYPRWTLCVPRDPIISFYLSSAIMNILDDMRSVLKRSAFIHRNPVAQSSANVTTLGGRLRQQELAQRRSREPQGDRPTKDKSEVELKKLVCKRRCLCLPADGTEAKFVAINFFEQPKNYRSPEPAHWPVPDFRNAWGECTFERNFRLVTVENQEIKALEGDYVFYWCRNDSLDENQYIKHLLGLESVELHRRFWHGDVFLVKHREESGSFETTILDVPLEVLQADFSRLVLTRYWREAFLEEDAKLTAGESPFEKLENDKEILRSRMSHWERDVLKQMPAGTLDFLAMTACDDGAMMWSNFENDPENPDMVKLTSVHAKTAVEKLQWDGFSSGQL